MGKDGENPKRTSTFRGGRRSWQKVPQRIGGLGDLELWKKGRSIQVIAGTVGGRGKQARQHGKRMKIKALLERGVQSPGVRS